MARRGEIFGFDQNLVLIAGLGIGAFLLFPKMFGKFAASAAAGAVNVVTDAASGVVVGIGESVGIPETDAQKCENAITSGEYWEASFWCPAGRFLKASTGAVYDSVGELIGFSPATGHPEIIGIQYSAQLPGEFGYESPEVVSSEMHPGEIFVSP